MRKTILLIAICCAACSRNPGSEDISALENAYKSGVLTKQEYDAKKAVLIARSEKFKALDKALDDGVLTKDEYQAKKAAMLASDPQPAPTPVPSPAPAPAPVVAVSKPPEPAPIVAPLPKPPAANTPTTNQPTTNPPTTNPPTTNQPTTNQPTTNQAHALRMKMVKIMDEHGFERPMASVTMLIPTDWQSQGATTWNIKDSCNTIQTTVHTTGPDGRGFDVFPAYNWTWADDPKPLQQIFAQKAQYGTHACDVIPPMNATDYLRRNLSRIRPNAQVVSIEPDTKLMQILQQQARQTEQAGAQYRLQQQVRPDVIRARVKYSLNGRAMEEWIIAATTITGTLGPSYNVQQARMTQAYSYSCVGNMVAERAPQGQLDGSAKFFELINSTYRVNPAWQSRVAGNAQAIQQIELKGVRDRSAIVTKNAEDIRNIQREGYENQQRSQDRISEQRSQTMRGVETYRDPTSGETVELSNQYGHAWVNNRGEYLLSDQEGFDPSVTFKEDWKPLEHVKP